jgi:ubiquinone biosynthesis protein Coq4
MIARGLLTWRISSDFLTNLPHNGLGHVYIGDCRPGNLNMDLDNST